MNILLWFIMLIINFSAIMLAYRLWGKLGLFIWIPISVIAANIQVVKTVEIFGFIATLGNIVYATSFLVTDILNENYGRKDASKAVGIGFFALISMTALMQFALMFVPHESDFAHDSIQTIFGIMPRIALGSLAAYALSQLHDVWSYDRLKEKRPGKRYIWIRNNLSTMISQLIDSLVFTLIAFAGVFETAVLMEIMLTTYMFKWIVAAADTPFIYLARDWKDKGIV
ncbi:MAG: queuosine precursor transporter [Spirochaetales bacterium]|uniref:Probable queuosine precursor transporter n=1 Tax=Candidatus Thalassospirochaeta sargassi TaxID=3119039 RepID=A0AAJ1IDI2_9SPIO|nr:queuosine precursor transporter [Spirochaetales bacterium]